MSAARDSAQLAGLYQDMILDHYRRPRNKGELQDADARASLKNPLCGDEIEVQLSLDGDRVREIRFAGRGCSISQASASMMTQLARGRTAAELAVLTDRFAALLGGDATAAADEALGDLRALSGVSRFPSRHRCATLAWDAMRRALAASGAL
jgi:nitrogen fixation protein NifU and related proteins